MNDVEEAQFIASHAVIYVGCLAIARSMKDTIFEDRSALTKECITRVAESARCISTKDRKIPSYIKEYVKDVPDLTFGGYSVELKINTITWSVNFLETNRALFCHQVKNISFASAGEGFTADFVAYVAKNDSNDRRCYVFDCPSGNAQEIITSISNAFKLRFEQVTKSPLPLRPSCSMTPASQSRTTTNTQLIPEISFSTNCTSSDTLGHNGHETVKLPANFDLLQQEFWFHGRLSREQSESIVKHNGEFLVRQSDSQPSQFVLTGMQDGLHRHLLLMDGDGNVRTKDRNFADISDLIHFHRSNNVPISSTESSLILRTPIHRH